MYGHNMDALFFLAMPQCGLNVLFGASMNGSQMNAFLAPI